MPVAIQPKTLDNIVEAVRVRAKIDTTDTDTLDAIKGFINQRYLNVATEHNWRWLHEKRDIRIPPKYSTGTVSVTQDSREITGSSTVWTDDHKGWVMKISGEENYFNTVDINSNTQLELSERIVRSSGSSLTYEMYQSDFGMWPDLENIETIFTDTRGPGHPMQAITPEEYWELVARNPADSGDARYYTRLGFKNYEGVPIGQIVVGYDFIGTPSSNRLAVFPRIPSARGILHINYTKKIEPLAAGSDEPLMPMEDRWVLVYGALADLYNLLGTETSMAYWNSEFEKGVKRMLRDNTKTDSKARLVVNDIWRRGRDNPSPGRFDLGDYFDKFY